jgi:hypothetical protein
MGERKQVGELRVSIGDIIISLTSISPGSQFVDEDPYRSFISDGEAEVDLQVHYGSIPEHKQNREIFDTGTTWSMFTKNGKYILKTGPRIAIFESDFKSGKIYINRSGRNAISPLSYPLTELLMINLLSQGRGVLAHSCGIDNNGKGMLFVGESGAGKSTLSNLWKDKKDVTVLSDDRIIIRKIDGRFWMYGTPWHGDAKACSPEKVPLEKIFFLRHARENSVSKISEIDAVSKLIVCSFPTFWDKKGMEFTLGFINELTREVPCYELGFVPDKRIIDLVKSI